MTQRAAPATRADGFQAAPGQPREPVEQLVHAKQPVGLLVVVDHLAQRCGAAGSRAPPPRAPNSAPLMAASRAPPAGSTRTAQQRNWPLPPLIVTSSWAATWPRLASLSAKATSACRFLARVVRHHDEVQRRRSPARRQHGRRGVAPSSAVLEPLREAIGHRRGPEVGRALHRRACCRRRATGKGAHRAESTLSSRRKRRPLRRPWALGRTSQGRRGALLASFDNGP